MADLDTISSNKTATKASSLVKGVLDKFIPQISKNTQFFSSDSKSWELVLKGPILKYEDLQQLLNYYSNNTTDKTTIENFISTTSNLIQWDTSYYGGGVNMPITQILFPYTDPKYSWHIESYRMEQCDAGLHCIVTTIWSINIIQSNTDDKPIPLNTYWSLSMQPVMLDVLQYCADPVITDELNGDPNGKACSFRIKQWASVDNNNNVLKSQYQYAAAVGSVGIISLNDSEIAIGKFYDAGVNPQFHYPVVQLNQEYAGKNGTQTVDITMIDKIASEIPECPFKLGTWKWLQTGYNASYNKVSDITTITTEWTGAEDWREEFYSSDPKIRWKIHNM